MSQLLQQSHSANGSRVVRCALIQTGGMMNPAEIFQRQLELVREAAGRGAQVICLQELATGPYFCQVETREWFALAEPVPDGPSTVAVSALAAELGVVIVLPLYENARGDFYNTAVVVDADGSYLGKYRKVHIPGHEHHEPDRPFQHAERYYFTPSTEGFPVWDAFGGRVGMMICNDRRWPESYRVMGLQGVEMILCGYNTPLHYVPDPTQDPLQGFHNGLVMQSGAYQNGTFVVGVAKGGVEEGVDSLADSMIVAPSGEILKIGRAHV